MTFQLISKNGIAPEIVATFPKNTEITIENLYCHEGVKTFRISTETEATFIVKVMNGYRLYSTKCHDWHIKENGSTTRCGSDKIWHVVPLNAPNQLIAVHQNWTVQEYEKRTQKEECSP